MSCLPHFLPTGSIYHPRSDSRILKESDGDHAGHGLRTPNEAFFEWNPKFLGLGLGIWSIYGQTKGQLTSKCLLVSSISPKKWTWTCRPGYHSSKVEFYRSFFKEKLKTSKKHFEINWPLSVPILVQKVPCPCLPLFNHYFYKKLSL